MTDGMVLNATTLKNLEVLCNQVARREVLLFSEGSGSICDFLFFFLHLSKSQL